MQKALGLLVVLGTITLIGYGLSIGIPWTWGKVNDGLDCTIKKTEGRSVTDTLKKHGG